MARPTAAGPTPPSRVWGDVVAQSGGLNSDSKMAFDSTGRLLATTGEAGISLWDVEAGMEIRFLRYRNKLPTPVAPAFSPDGRFVARIPILEICASCNVGGPPTPPDVWSISTGEPVGDGRWSETPSGLQDRSVPWTFNELASWRTLRTKEAVAHAASYAGEGHFFTRDGALVVTTNHAEWPHGMSTVRVIRTEDGGELLSRETGVIARFDASSDGRWLATSDIKNDLHVFAVPSGEERSLQMLADDGSRWTKRFTTTDGISSFAFSPDGALFALWTRAGISIFEAGQMAQILQIPTGPERVEGLVFGPDGRRLASLDTSAFASSVVIRDAATGRDLRHLQSHTCPVDALLLSPDNQQLAVVTCELRGAPPDEYASSVVRLWDLASGAGPRAVPVGGQRETISLAFPRGRQHLLVGKGSTVFGMRNSGMEGEVALWDLATGERSLQLTPTEPFEFASAAVAVSPGGDRLVAIVYRMRPLEPDDSGISAYLNVEYDATVREWDADTGKLESNVLLESQSGKLSLSPNSKRVVGRTAEGQIEIIDAGTGKVLRELTEASHWLSPEGSPWFPDSRNLVVFNTENLKASVEIWDSTTGQRVRRLEGEVQQPDTMVVSADGSRVAAGGCDGRIIVWAEPDWNRVFSVLGHEGCVRAVAFRGSTLISAGADGFIRFWDASGGWTALLASSAAGNDWIVAAPDGRYDGTPQGARTLIGFRVGQSVVSAPTLPGSAPTRNLLPLRLDHDSTPERAQPTPPTAQHY